LGRQAHRLVSKVDTAITTTMIKSSQDGYFSRHPLNRRRFLLGLVAGGLGSGLGLTLGRKEHATAQTAIPNPSRGTVRLAVISDLNSSYGSTDYEPEVDRVMAVITQTWRPDLVLCAGDMVAGQSRTLSPAKIQAMWRGFDQHVAAPLRQAKIPFGLTIGNHDGSGALDPRKQFIFAEDRKLASSYWRNLQQQVGLKFIDATGFPFYYTFEQKGIFYLVWDASTANIPSSQIAWAERSLAAAQSARLRMVLGHLPLHGISVGRERAGDYLDQAKRLQGIFERYNVSTYISGHDHAYYPGRVGKLQTLQCGLLGSGARRLIAGNLPPQKNVTLLDITFPPGNPPSLVYNTYEARTLQPVALQTLPKQILTANGTVIRRDL
jgi:Calcineurin-like phosphoesterase